MAVGTCHKILWQLPVAAHGCATLLPVSCVSHRQLASLASVAQQSSKRACCTLRLTTVTQRTPPGAAQAAVLSAKGHTPGGKVRPSVMAFSRQGMPNLPGTSKEGVLKGGYIVHGGDAKPDVILLATGAPPRLIRPPQNSVAPGAQPSRRLWLARPAQPLLCRKADRALSPGASQV